MDVVPGGSDQFEPRVEGDRLIGRGAYDMKGALAVMLTVLHSLRDQDGVRLRLGIVSDEESEEEQNRGSDALVASGFLGDFAITGEPTNLQVGVQAKGVLAIRLEVQGRSAHGATPWLGDNAVVKAVEVFRGIESLPFARHSSALFDRPSINLGRIMGGDALNKVPDSCVIDVDIRFLPDQDPDEILEQVSGMPDTRVLATFRRPPAVVEPDSPFVQGLCRGGLAAPPRAGDERRSRRRLRCGLLPGGGGARRRVRAGRRRSPRARRVGLDRLAAQLPPGAGGLRRGPSRGWPRDATRSGIGGRAATSATSAPDETQEDELGDDFLADIDDEEELEPEREELEDEDLEDEELDDEDLEDEELRGRGPTKSRSTTRTSSSRSSRPRPRSGTASRRPRSRGGGRRADLVARAGSAITSGFERVEKAAGPEDHLGLQGGPQPRRLPGLAALPDRVVPDRRLDRHRDLGQPDPLPLGHRQRAQARQRRLSKSRTVLTDDALERSRRRS